MIERQDSRFSDRNIIYTTAQPVRKSRFDIKYSDSEDLNNDTLNEGDLSFYKEEKTRRRLVLFFKQCIAVAVIIIICMLIKKSNFEFGKNCVSALQRAVRWEFDFSAAASWLGNVFQGWLGFWSDVF